MNSGMRVREVAMNDTAKHFPYDAVGGMRQEAAFHEKPPCRGGIVPPPARFVILGSASPDLLQQSSESLAGRMERIMMRGFSQNEAGFRASTRRPCFWDTRNVVHRGRGMSWKKLWGRRDLPKPISGRLDGPLAARAQALSAQRLTERRSVHETIAATARDAG